MTTWTKITDPRDPAILNPTGKDRYETREGQAILSHQQREAIEGPSPGDWHIWFRWDDRGGRLLAESA